jgi:hypothetical protein
MTPLEAMARVAALVPPPRSPVLHYHGVLSAGSPLRSLIVPVRDTTRESRCTREAKSKASDPDEGNDKHDRQRRSPKTTQPPEPSRDPSGAAAVVAVPSPPPLRQPCPLPPPSRPWRPSTSYIPWRELIRRTFDIDPAECDRCRARLEPVAIITRDDVIERILAHLSLPVSAAPIGPGGSMAWDVTGEPIPDWAIGMDPEPPPADERSPPDPWDGVDPPGPEW